MKDLIQRKLEGYRAKSSEEEENALKEITQEVALFALSKSGFFTYAAFQGGTCLRIVHGLDRFSEDLDFALRKPAADFSLGPFLDEAKKMMTSFGYSIEVAGSDRLDRTIQTRFLKDDSIKLQLKLKHHFDVKKKIQIKVEIDVNPPIGANSVTAFVDFPLDFSISTHDLPSLFAGKCHALLCREYTKGRDWYDFSWYVARNTPVNTGMLANALHQVGPWREQGVDVDYAWLKTQLALRVQKIDWTSAVKDVERFVRQDQREALGLWGKDFFEAKLEKMFRGWPISEHR